MSLAAFGVRKPVVANLVMFAIIGAGLIFGLSLRKEFFPEVSPSQVLVTVFGEETIAHRSDDIQLFSYGVVDKVCVDQDVVRRSKWCIILKEERRYSLFYLSRFVLLLLFFLFLLGSFYVGLYPVVLGADDLLRNCELACFLGLAHGFLSITMAANYSSGSDFADICNYPASKPAVC